VASGRRTPDLPLGMTLLARYPLPKLPGRAPLEVVVAEGHRQVVTWMHNLDSDSYFWGRYFYFEAHDGCRYRTLAAAFDDFQTRARAQLNYICATCDLKEGTTCPSE
jgi:hypothetical protein